ncbi:MAG: glycosyltransferase [Candidatus Helarchaeota archaeon]
MARRLVAAGHDVTLLTSSANLGEIWAPKSGWHSHKIKGIRLEVLKLSYSNEMSFATRIKAFFKFSLSASWHIRKFKADIVFATSTPLTIAIPALVAKFWHRIPIVFEVRDLWPELPIAVGALRHPLSKILARALEWMAYHASAHIVALSPGMAEGIMSRGILYLLQRYR